MIGMTQKSFVTTKPRGTQGRFTDSPDINWQDSPLIVDSVSSLEDAEPLSGDGGPFYVDKTTFDGGVINLPYGGYWAPWFYNYVADAVAARQAGLSDHILTQSPDGAWVATEVVARTNPSRAHVDLVTAVAELKDFPLLFKRAGDSLFERMADLNLKYHFGWKPLVSDALKLFQFGDAVDKRIKEMERLKAKGLRRTIRIGTYREEQQFNYVLQSVDRFIQVAMTKVTIEDVWGFVEWTPESDFPKTSTEMRALARRAVLGLIIDPSTAWELIPFSWLADWCGNVGTFLQASRNIIPASHGQVQVMRHTRTECTCGEVVRQDEPLTMSGVKVSHETKRRSLSSASLSAQLPFLDGRQMSILGSIGLLSGGNRINHR